MHDQRASAGKSHIRHKRRVRFIAVIIALVVIIACVLCVVAYWPDPHSPDERLAQIDAARAIPDAENAAMIYNRLLRDPNAASVLSPCPPFLEPPIFDQVREKPWLGKDHPDLAACIKEHQYVIDRLLDAARLEKCRFPLSIDIADTSSMDRAVSMRQWGFLLRIVANNDIAEGRIDAATTKWQCLLRMSNHLSQQPLPIDHLVAVAVRELALQNMARFIVEGNPTEAQLQKIETMSLPATGGGAGDLQETREVERLVEQKMMEGFGPLDRLKSRLWRYRFNRAVYGTLKGPDLDRDLQDQYLRGIVAARGTQILIAIKRYKDTTGHWPASLDKVKPPLSKEILTDPLNGGPFVYQPVGDTFRLYSRGRNNIDEGGQWQSEAADDWPIWPPRTRSPEAGQKSEDK